MPGAILRRVVRICGFIHADGLMRRCLVQAPVLRQAAVYVAVEPQLPALEHAHASADRLYRGGRMRHEQDRLPGFEKRLERAHALTLELLVAHGEDFVE